MPDLETIVFIDLTIYCNDCGEKLSWESTNDRNEDPVIDVDPCSNCLLNEYERGIEEGGKNAS